MSLLVDNGVGACGKLVVKVKIKVVATTCYIDPLYGTKLDIIFDKKTKLFRRSFQEKYGIYNEGITLKRLKIGKEIKEEVVGLFGPYNCNDYRYYHIEDKILISLRQRHCG